MQIAVDHRPHRVEIDVVVLMDDDAPLGNDLTPRDVWGALARFGGDLPGRLADQYQPMGNGVLDHCVPIEGCAPAGREPLNLFGDLDDLPEESEVAADQSGMASARTRARSSGRRRPPARVTLTGH